LDLLKEYRNRLKKLPVPLFVVYWTAGRDALSEDQFMWHNSHITIKESGLTINEYVPAYQCLIYRKQYDSEEGFLHTGACNGEEKVLCELQ